MYQKCISFYNFQVYLFLFHFESIVLFTLVGASIILISNTHLWTLKRCLTLFDACLQGNIVSVGELCHCQNSIDLLVSFPLCNI